MNARKWSERATAALAVLMVLALVSMAAPTAVVHAATTRTINVDDVPDDLPLFGCTLREAIGIANAGGTGTHFGCTVVQTGSGSPLTYHINLPKGKYTYTLTGAAAEDNNASGDLDITANVTITGWGAGGSIIDGGGIDRVFHICPGGGCAKSVTFTGVTIRNGNTTGGGGGIYNEDGAVTVDGSTVSDNRASNGGGISNEGGTVTVDGSTISGNTADSYGGGIANKGTLIVQNGCIIGGAGVGNEAAYDGGGIYNGAVGNVSTPP
ncbi:MAG: hypothetical protein JXA14_25260 [Anaerolineae bacterium]|nr:hypothetical protein [Anaerolineae bacterium]